MKVVDLGAALKFKSDLPLFYLAECCPNLTYLILNEKFRVTPCKSLIIERIFHYLLTIYFSDRAHLDNKISKIGNSLPQRSTTPQNDVQAG